jgi:hypothetical protein
MPATNTPSLFPDGLVDFALVIPRLGNCGSIRPPDIGSVVSRPQTGQKFVPSSTWFPHCEQYIAISLSAGYRRSDDHAEELKRLASQGHPKLVELPGIRWPIEGAESLRLTSAGRSYDA